MDQYDPEIGDLELGDILDTEAIQSLMNDFYDLAHIPMAILDNHGKVLVRAGWQEICTEFHRVHPETLNNCLESDTQLTRGIAPGDFKLYRCKNRLCDVATPFMVGGRQFGNIFTGQFLLNEEPFDEEVFTAQARQYGFDQDRYLAALRSVPRLNRETVENAITFLRKAGDIIGRLGYSNIKLNKSLNARAQTEQALRAAYAELAAIQAEAPVLLLVIDEKLRVQRANQLAARFSGATVEEMLDVQPGEALHCLNALGHPDGCGEGPDCRDCTLRGAVLDTFHTGTRHDNVEKWLPVSRNGRPELRCLLVSCALMDHDPPKKVLICALDVTDLKRAQIEVEKNHEYLVRLNRDLDGRLEQLQSALAEKDVLFKEMQHRVKNNLQVISSLLSLQAEQLEPGPARRVLSECHDRVRSMALIHEQLCYSGKMAQIEFAQYITRLAGYLLHSYEVHGGRVRVYTDIIATITLEQAVPCGLIVQELLSNSLKHAFPNDVKGEIRIDLVNRDGEYRLGYRDNGIGLPPGFDITRTRSLGMQLISDLTAQLRGRLVTSGSGGGTYFLLTFPAAGRATLACPLAAR